MTTLASSESRWYKAESNTAKLVQKIVSLRLVKSLGGQQIYALLRLTWVTKVNGVIHWEKNQAEALETLFENKNQPPDVRIIATQRTGFVNAYPAYRNSLKGWCEENVDDLRSILEDANNLADNDQDRLNLASRIDDLPHVSTPNKARAKSASDFITPLVACLDPKQRFPIINGQRGVKERLARLGLTVNCGLRDKTEGFIRLIDKSNFSDAFAMDTMHQDQIKKIRTSTRQI